VLGFVLGGLVAMTVLFLVINFWFRRGDERIRTTLSEIQSKNNPPPFVNDEPAGEATEVPRAFPATGSEPPAGPGDKTGKDPERN